MKLYKVSTKSFTAYVVAKNPLIAENTFVNWLDSEDYGYSSDRVVTLNNLDMKLNVKYYSGSPVIILPALIISDHDLCLGWLKWGIVLSW